MSSSSLRTKHRATFGVPSCTHSNQWRAPPPPPLPAALCCSPGMWVSSSLCAGALHSTFIYFNGLNTKNRVWLLFRPSSAHERQNESDPWWRNTSAKPFSWGKPCTKYIYTVNKVLKRPCTSLAQPHRWIHLLELFWRQRWRVLPRSSVSFAAPARVGQTTPLLLLLVNYIM